MAKITLDLPDEWMEQFVRTGENPSDWLSQRLPELITLSSEQHILPAHVYRYILDFIASNPNPEQVANFRPTPEMQQRLQTLLERHQSGTLTPWEQAELDEYERIEHLVILLKAGNVNHLVGQV